MCQKSLHSSQNWVVVRKGEESGFNARCMVRRVLGRKEGDKFLGMKTGGKELVRLDLGIDMEIIGPPWN